MVTNPHLLNADSNKLLNVGIEAAIMPHHISITVHMAKFAIIHVISLKLVSRPRLIILGIVAALAMRPRPISKQRMILSRFSS